MRKVVRPIVAILLSLALGVILQTRVDAASSQGILSGSSKLQTYDSSITDGLDEYITLLGPVITKNGSIYAINPGYNGDEPQILKFNADKTLSKTFAPPPGYNLSPPLGITSDSQNNTYFPAEINQETEPTTRIVILKYDSNDQLVNVIDPSGVGPDARVSDIVSMSVASDGTIYLVADLNNESRLSLLTVDQSGHTLSRIDQITGNVGAYSTPFLVALNSRDEIYIGAIGDDESAGLMNLFRINNSGYATARIGDNTPLDIGYSLAVDHNDNIYFLNLSSDSSQIPQQDCPLSYELRKYNSQGQLVGSIDTSSAASNGPVCSLYGGGVTPPFAANMNVGSDGDIYLGTGDYGSSQPGKARIVIYKTPKNIATFQASSSSQGDTPSAKLELPEGIKLTNAIISAPNDISAPQDGTNRYPLGLVNFIASVNNTNPVDVTLQFVTDLAPEQVVARKYSPSSKSYADIPSATISRSTVNGQSALTLNYKVTDGGPLDEDGIVNGEIVDPVGLAVSNASIPIPLAPNAGAEPHGITSTLFFVAALGGGSIASIIIVRRLAHRQRS